MGNKICKSNSLSGAHGTMQEIAEFLSCGNIDSDEEEGQEEVTVSPSKFVDGPRNPPGGQYVARSPVPVRQQPANSPSRLNQQGLPGESCLVTYDVGAMGYGASAAYPGQSMVVTGSHLESRNSELVLPPAVVAAKPQLESTQSFSVDVPFKVGDQIMLWSSSQQKWCNGIVDKAQGEWVHISYKGPEGRDMSKIMPNHHEHIQHPWGNLQPPRERSLPSSPQKGLSPIPESPGGAQTGSLFAGASNYPAEAGVCTYKVGDDVEMWSTSQNAWCRGRVEKAEGDWINISYKGPGGQPMTKLMPNGHEELRFPPSTYAQQPRIDQLTPIQSHADFLPPPPPSTASYKAGDQIEIWSTSQNAWRPGSITTVDGEWVHVSYADPTGQPMNKIMPNGHAHLRLQAGFAA